MVKGAIVLLLRSLISGGLELEVMLVVVVESLMLRMGGDLTNLYSSS